MKQHLAASPEVSVSKAAPPPPSRPRNPRQPSREVGPEADPWVSFEELVRCRQFDRAGAGGGQSSTRSPLHDSGFATERFHVDRPASAGRPRRGAAPRRTRAASQNGGFQPHDIPAAARRPLLPVPHGPDAAKRKVGLRLDQREGALAKLESGAAAIAPGNPAALVVAHRIESTDDENACRRQRPTIPEQRSLLEALDRGGRGMETALGLHSPVRPAIPTITTRVAAGMASTGSCCAPGEGGLEPSPEADRRTLARRVSLDLTGLPDSRRSGCVLV